MMPGSVMMPAADIWLMRRMPRRTDSRSTVAKASRGGAPSEMRASIASSRDAPASMPSSARLALSTLPSTMPTSAIT